MKSATHLRALAIAVIAAPLFIALVSCNEQTSVPVDYGTEVDPATINDALSNPTASMDPTLIRQGEFAHVADTQILDAGAQTAPIDDIAKTVTSRTEDANNIYLAVQTDTYTYNADGTMDKASKQDQFTLSKTGSNQAAALGIGPKIATADSPTPTPTPGVSPSPSASPDPGDSPAPTPTPDGDSNVTYHNLKTWDDFEAPPAAVIARHNCGGLPGCTMHVYHVSFDQVQWNANGTNSKVHYDFTMSPSVPYLAQQLGKCYSLLVTVPGSQTPALVEQCSNIVDFSFDNTTP